MDGVMEQGRRRRQSSVDMCWNGGREDGSGAILQKCAPEKAVGGGVSMTMPQGTLLQLWKDRPLRQGLL
jgi:hypothetical protein